MDSSLKGLSELFSLLSVIFIVLLLFVGFYCKYYYTKFAQCSTTRHATEI